MRGRKIGWYFKHNMSRSEILVSNPAPNLISYILWQSRQADKSVYLLSFLIAYWGSKKLGLKLVLLINLAES